MVGTRPENVGKRPGKVVAPKAKRKTEEVTATQKAAQAAKKGKAAAKKKKLEELANMEVEMQEEENASRARRSQRLKPSADSGSVEGTGSNKVRRYTYSVCCSLEISAIRNGVGRAPRRHRRRTRTMRKSPRWM